MPATLARLQAACTDRREEEAEHTCCCWSQGYHKRNSPHGPVTTGRTSGNWSGVRNPLLCERYLICVLSSSFVLRCSCAGLSGRSEFWFGTGPDWWKRPI